MTEILMPAMGESIHEATVLTWLKKPGDHVEIDEPLLEVATDKVDTEIPSTHTGILKEILIQEGQVAVIGKPICRVESIVASEEKPATETPAPDENSSPEEVASFLESNVNAAASSLGPRFETPATQSRYYSPLVLTICEKEGISMEELNALPGTGADGRVTKNDILDYVANRSTQPVTPKAPDTTPTPQSATVTAPKPATVSSGNVEIIEMDRMRKIIAERMVDSKRVAPHVSSFVETDMTTLSRWRDRMKVQFQKEYGENLTYTPLLIEAVVKAIKDFPMINSSVEGDKILVKKAVNVGMAVALPNGNLIVPRYESPEQSGYR